MATTTSEVADLFTTALSVEKLDTFLFRSKHLSTPRGARGVFGGQIISLALVAATECVDSKYALHSMHCYFLYSATDALPLLLYVEKVREGRTYSTRSVKAVQNGRAVFVMMCSFKTPEPGAGEFALPAPKNVQPPELCLNAETHYQNLLGRSDLTLQQRKRLETSLADRRRSPIDISFAGVIPYTEGVKDGELQRMFWMRPKSVPKMNMALRKCVIAYLSDLRFLTTAVEASGLSFSHSAPPAQQVGMTSSLDHSIFFYTEEFDVNDWVLYAMDAVRTGSGRGVSTGRIYTRHGDLIAIITQEGVIRPKQSYAPQKEATEVERARL
ncbi:Thioesterase/thiol ester dehydrase-isomerase [Auriculariales sp. MPI-PUGE-AT-0066]|nr:Thioesterase/thiol ester dehydrase-isomerase [Auriculariales sp. MPI-PUGE-AT-0066]